MHRQEIAQFLWKTSVIGGRNPRRGNAHAGSIGGQVPCKDLRVSSPSRVVYRGLGEADLLIPKRQLISSLQTNHGRFCDLVDNNICKFQLVDDKARSVST